MEKFVEFELHEYMDMYPQKQVITMKGENLEQITENSREYAKQMTKHYSGGPTRFIKVMSAKEARMYLDTEIAKIKRPDSADKDWIEEVNKLFNKCYN